MTSWLPEGGAIVRAKGIAENLHLGPVMQARNGLHEVAGGMVTEVGRDVPNTETTVRGPTRGVLVGWLVENSNLWGKGQLEIVITQKLLQ